MNKFTGAIKIRKYFRDVTLRWESDTLSVKCLSLSGIGRLRVVEPFMLRSKQQTAGGSFGDMGVITVEIGDVLCLLSSEVNWCANSNYCGCFLSFFHISSRYQSSSLRRESEAHGSTPDLVKVWWSSLRWLLRHLLVFGYCIFIIKSFVFIN